MLFRFDIKRVFQHGSDNGHHKVASRREEGGAEDTDKKVLAPTMNREAELIWPRFAQYAKEYNRRGELKGDCDQHGGELEDHCMLWSRTTAHFVGAEQAGGREKSPNKDRPEKQTESAGGQDLGRRPGYESLPLRPEPRAMLPRRKIPDAKQQADDRGRDQGQRHEAANSFPSERAQTLRII